MMQAHSKYVKKQLYKNSIQQFNEIKNIGIIKNLWEVAHWCSRFIMNHLEEKLD